MTPSPRTVKPGTSLANAARVMAEDDIGDVLVADVVTGRLVGIVTDRDIAIRAVAESRDADTTTVKDIVSAEVVSAAPSDTVQETLELMKGLNVRRLPVVEGGRAIGVVSLGDLSVETDVGSTLAEHCTAPPRTVETAHQRRSEAPDRTSLRMGRAAATDRSAADPGGSGLVLTCRLRGLIRPLPTPRFG